MAHEGTPAMDLGRGAGPAPRSRLFSLRVVAVFLAFSLVWVIGGDILVRWWFGPTSAHVVAETIKGILFVLVASTVLYFAIRQAIDVSARSARDAARTQRLYQAVLDQVPVAAWAKDRDGRYLAVNAEAAYAMRGRAPEEIVGRTDMELYGESDPELARRVRTQDLRVLETGQPVRVEDDRGLDPRRVFLVVKAPLRDDAGNIYAVAGIAPEMTEQKLASEELERISAHRRELLQELSHAEERERSRIAQDVHDDTIQVMTALIMQMDLAAADAANEKQRARLDQMVTTAQEAVRRLRRLIFELHPAALERVGLVPALEEQLLELRNYWGVEYDLRADLDEEPPLETRALAFRSAKEALVNVRRHAGADRVMVEVSGTGGSLRVLVQDDGCGFDPHAATRSDSFGLTAMRDRVVLAGGSVVLDSSPGRGTKVEICLPVK